MAVTRTSVGTMVSGAAAITPLFGAGATAGDFGILIVETANQSLSAPSGWTQKAASTGFGTAGAAGASKQYIFTKNSITAGDISSGISVADSGDHQNAVLLTYSGVDTSATLNVSTPLESSTASTSVNTNAVGSGSGKNGGVVLGIVTTDRDSNTVSTNTSPSWSGITGSNSFIVNGSSATGTGGGIIVNELVANADATGFLTFSCSITSSAYAATVFALVPATSAQTLTPSVYSNSQNFLTPTVSPGAVTLTPSLFSTSQTIFNPTASSSYALTAALYSNGQSFFTPTLTQGPVTLGPSLYSDGDTFFAPTVTPGVVTLSPNLVTVSQTFPTPTITATYGLTPSLFADADSFYAPVISPLNTLSPSLYTDGDTFFAPIVSASYSLVPALHTDGDTFLSPTVSASYTVSPGLYSSTPGFYPPVVTQPSLQVDPSLFTDGDSFHAPTVTTSYALISSLYTNGQSYYGPTIVQTQLLAPLLFANNQTFYVTQVLSTAGGVGAGPRVSAVFI